MKIELTIKADYLPTWGAYEGLRELIQNAKDAALEFNATLDVRHRKDTDTLVIENEGCVIPHEALLFGHTTKSERSDTIGKFGEGLKLGVLALVRAGHQVKIRSGSEVWFPAIEKSEKFNANVLAFQIEKGRQEKNRVQIEIDKITAEDWAQFKKCFLFIDAPKKDESVQTNYGMLLLRNEDKGKLFVKGIFVQHNPKFNFGYNFLDAEVDRDRKMISSYDLDWRTRAIWSASVRTRPDLFKSFMDLVEEEAQDVAGIDEYSAKNMPTEVLTKVQENFHAKFGKDAVPVATIAESKDLEHLGKKGIVVNKPLRATLQAIMGSTEDVKNNLRKEIVRQYSWSELTDAEKQTLESEIALVNEVEPVTLDSVDIVDFRSSNLNGMYKGDGQRVLVAKKLLSDRAKTLEVLVHEVAHRNGGDGEKDHVAQIESMWSRIVENLRKGA